MIELFCCVALLAPSGATGATDSSKSGNPMQLGFADSQPAVYLPLRAGMTVRLAEIRYDQFGRLAGYEEEIALGGEKTIVKISVDPALEASKPESYRYAAEVNGKATSSPSLAKWEETAAKGLLGFAATDLGGVILHSRGALEIDATTRFAYDEFGRRMLAEQEFADEGVKYGISYSGYKFDKFGRLGGYSAEVKRAE